MLALARVPALAGAPCLVAATSLIGTARISSLVASAVSPSPDVVHGSSWSLAGLAPTLARPSLKASAWSASLTRGFAVSWDAVGRCCAWGRGAATLELVACGQEAVTGSHDDFA
jgi:hypothetical protein